MCIRDSPSTLTADAALLLAKLSDAELAPLDAAAEDVGVDPAPYYTCLLYTSLKIAIITGAEGGFAAEEAEMAAKAGAKTVGLGPRILRCETAPLAVVSAVMTLTGNLE